MVKSATREVDFDTGPTKLYRAISNSEWNVASSIAKLDPEEAETWVVRKCFDQASNTTRVLWRFLPLHSACARQPPDDLIRSLLKAYPEAAFSRDDQGMLPLHYACTNNASEVVVSMLLMTNPSGAAVKDPKEARLPIHSVCQWGCSTVGVLNMLLVAFPDSIYEKDNNGYTPLDLAKIGHYDDKYDVIAAIEQCEQAGKIRNAGCDKNDTLKDSSAPRTTSTPKHGMSPKRSLTPRTKRESKDEIAKYEAEIEKLNVKIKKLKSDLSTAREEIQEMQANEVEKCERACERESEIATLRAEMEELRLELERVRGDVKAEQLSSRQALQIELDKSSDIMNDLNDAQDEAKVLKDKLKLLERENAHLSEANKKMNNVVASMQENNQENSPPNKVSQNRGKNFDNMMRESHEVTNSLEKAIKNRDDKIDSMHIEFSSVLSEMHVTQKKLKKVQAECTSLKMELAKTKGISKDSDSLQGENNRMKSDLQDLTKVLQNIHKKQENICRLSLANREKVRESCAKREQTILEVAKLERKIRPTLLSEHEQTRRLVEDQGSVLREVYKKIIS